MTAGNYCPLPRFFMTCMCIVVPHSALLRCWEEETDHKADVWEVKGMRETGWKARRACLQVRAVLACASTSTRWSQRVWPRRAH